MGMTNNAIMLPNVAQGTVITGDPVFIKDSNALPRDRVVSSPPFGMDYREWFKMSASLGLKMSAVRQKIERIAKNGRNQQQNYRYAEAADIYDECRRILHEEKLGFKVNLLREWEEIVKTQRGEARISKVHLLVTWTDLETGYPEEMNIVGTGLDHGDKGIYKAYTGAEKYALVLTFQIPTGDDPAKGGADPEKDFPDLNPEPSFERPQQEQQGGRNSRSTSGNRRSTTPSKAAESHAEPPKKNQDDNKKEEDNAPQGGADDANEPISAELKNEVEIFATILAGYSDDSDKKKAKSGIYESLKTKLKCKIVDPKDYTMGQGREALKYLHGWIDQRKEKQRKKEEAVQQQLESKRMAEEFDQKLEEENRRLAEEQENRRGEESQVTPDE